MSIQSLFTVGQQKVSWVEASALNLGNQGRYVLAEDLLVTCSKRSMIFIRKAVDPILALFLLVVTARKWLRTILYTVGMG
jgi:hypothetical protein